MRTLLVWGLTFTMTFLNASQPGAVFTPPEIFVPSRIGDVQLIHDGTTFSVIKDGVIYPVDPNNIESHLKEMTTEQLLMFVGRGTSECYPIPQEQVEQFKLDEYERVELSHEDAQAILEEIVPLMQHNTLAMNQSLCGQYSLTIKCPLLGGGPGAGWIAYWILKGTVYAVSYAIQGAVIVTVSTVASPVLGASIGIAITNACVVPTEIISNWVGIAAAVVVCAAPTL